MLTMDNLVEIIAIGLCAKTAIKNGGSGHGCWWELGCDAKEVFLGLASELLTQHDSRKYLDAVQEANNSPSLFSSSLASEQLLGEK
jgi:hypothetical protein